MYLPLTDYATVPVKFIDLSQKRIAFFRRHANYYLIAGKKRKRCKWCCNAHLKTIHLSKYQRNWSQHKKITPHFSSGNIDILSQKNNFHD